jgi:hypothetical protein
MAPVYTYGVSNADDLAQLIASAAIFCSIFSAHRWSLAKSGFSSTPEKPLRSQAH